jgi:hypothetical protein
MVGSWIDFKAAKHQVVISGAAFFERDCTACLCPVDSQRSLRFRERRAPRGSRLSTPSAVFISDPVEIEITMDKAQPNVSGALPIKGNKNKILSQANQQ